MEVDARGCVNIQLVGAKTLVGELEVRLVDHDEYDLADFGDYQRVAQRWEDDRVIRCSLVL